MSLKLSWGHTSVIWSLICTLASVVILVAGFLHRCLGIREIIFTPRTDQTASNVVLVMTSIINHLPWPKSLLLRLVLEYSLQPLILWSLTSMKVSLILLCCIRMLKHLINWLTFKIVVQLFMILNLSILLCGFTLSELWRFRQMAGIIFTPNTGVKRSLWCHISAVSRPWPILWWKCCWSAGLLVFETSNYMRHLCSVNWISWLIFIVLHVLLCWWLCSLNLFIVTKSAFSESWIRTLQSWLVSIVLWFTYFAFARPQMLCSLKPSQISCNLTRGVWILTMWVKDIVSTPAWWLCSWLFAHVFNFLILEFPWLPSHLCQVTSFIE